nr:3'(2'),5'-bisphosphate nucleotidase CysQ [uncultured Haemophilus sp.]
MQTLNQQLLEKVVDIAHQAGKHLKDFYAKSVEVHIKSDQTPVTEADLFLSQFITEKLKQLTPEIPVLSEENCNIAFEDRQKWDEYWIIDPLDGTQQFINRTDQFAVIIALVQKQEQKNRPVLGVIHAPILEKTYFAMQQYGCFLQKNGEIQPLHTLKQADHSEQNLHIAIGFVHPDHIEDNLIPPYQATFMEYGSSSLKSGLVAEGITDCYIRFGDTGEWDTTASEIMLSEIGGEIFDLHFNPLTYNERETLINPHFIMVRDKTRNWQSIFQFNKS